VACACTCCTGCTSIGCNPVDAGIDGIAIGGRILDQIALDLGACVEGCAQPNRGWRRQSLVEEGLPEKETKQRLEWVTRQSMVCFKFKVEIYFYLKIVRELRKLFLEQFCERI